MLKDTLKALVAIPGPSGAEAACAAYIEKEVAPYMDEVRRDVMGNLICEKKGSGKRVMLAAHMDQIGFIVTAIEEQGFLRVMPVGGISTRVSVAGPVRMKSGAPGVLFYEGGRAAAAEVPASQLFIDVGAASRQEAEKLAGVGDWATYAQPFQDMGGRVASPYMDDRAGCAVLLETLRTLSHCNCHLLAVFTTQEEVGLRGAGTAAYALQPDMAIAIDVTPSQDVPTYKQPVCTVKLGGGAAVKIMDKGVIAHPTVVEAMERAAREAGVKWQREVLTYGSTDAGAIHLSRAGVPSGTLSIPCRYVHAPCEMVDMDDLTACVALLRGVLQQH